MNDPGERLQRRGDYIWGSFVKPETLDGYIIGVNPGDRADVLGRFGFSTESVDDAVQGARDGFAEWGRVPIQQRSAAVLRFAELLEESTESLSVLITRETGKPLWESREEVAGAVRVARLLLSDGPSLLERRTLREGTAWSDFRPHGVVGVITPFNFPLLIPALHGLAALLAGNTVVFKPSKFTPGVGQAVAERMDRCRLPRGAFNLVQGSGAAVGHRLATHPGIDALLFAGSFDTAMAIRRATFERPELPTLYHCGGKGSAIVLKDADIERAVYDLAVSAYVTTGQRHNSCARVFVEKDVFDEFCGKMTERVQDLSVGYGFDEQVFMGPLISDVHRSRFRRFGKKLVSAGHTPLLEGGNLPVEGHRGYYVRPSLYWVERGDMLGDEPPGPTLLVYSVDDWAEAAELHNQLTFRVSTSMYTKGSGAQLEELTGRLRTGCLNLNRGTIGSSLRLPSVGQGRASNGIPADTELVRFLSTPRATLIDRRPLDESRWVPGSGAVPASGS